MGQPLLFAKELANMYRLFGDKTRLMMAKELAEEEWTVSEFVDLFQMSQPLVSQHLKKLKQHDLILEKRAGKKVLYRLNPEAKKYPLVLQLIDPLKK